MGARGPQPVPTPILAARGSWRAKLRDGEPRFSDTTPNCPASLKGEARAEWRRQVKQLRGAGLLSQADRAMLAAFCEAWGEFIYALRRLDEDGYTYETSKGYVGRNP